MKELQEHIFDEKNGLSYTLAGDYYILNSVLDEKHNNRSIGRWGHIRNRAEEMTLKELVYD